MDRGADFGAIEAKGIAHKSATYSTFLWKGPLYFDKGMRLFRIHITRFRFVAHQKPPATGLFVLEEGRD